MATSTLYQSSSLGSPVGNPRSCLYMSRQQTLQPKADWRASFTNTIREPCRALPPKPIILRQRDGEWLANINDILTHTQDPVSPQSEREASSAPKESGNKVTSPAVSKLTLSRVPKILRCHVCQGTVREQCFENHLFFGILQCDLCDLICKDCRLFERLRKDIKRGKSSCQHNFSYKEDPYDYLLPRVSGSDDMDVGGSLTLPNKLRVMQHHVNQLSSLQLREPWCTAVRKFKSRLLKLRTVRSPEHPGDAEVQKSPLETDGDRLDQENDAASLSDRTGWDGSLKTTPESLTCPSVVQQKIQGKNTDTGVLLTQSYDLQHLEQAVEYVELKEQCRVEGVQGQAVVHNKPKKRRKINHYKRLKGGRLTLPHKKKQPLMVSDPCEEADQDESHLVMEEVAFPEDGYYLMVHEAVDECPMCYEPLYPKDCSVTLRIFLFTIFCPQCGLVIYIVPNLPDGLQIVTNSSGSEMTQTKQNKQNELRNLRIRDFFAK